MVSITERVEPYWRNLTAEDHYPLLEFLCKAALVFMPEFTPPQFRTSKIELSSNKTARRFSSNKHGFEVERDTVFHPHWGYPAGDTLLARVYGLPPDCKLTLKAHQYHSEAGSSTYLELQVEGPEEAAAVIVEAFLEEFG